MPASSSSASSRSATAGSVPGADTTSTGPVPATESHQWVPSRLPGRGDAVAISATGRRSVTVATIAFGAKRPSVAQRPRFVARSSGAASKTRSAWAVARTESTGKTERAAAGSAPSASSSSATR